MDADKDHLVVPSLTAESLAEAVHTPGPWTVGEYDEHLGYDCMTGGIRVGPVCLDGADYGQKWCKEITPSALARMTADARLIAASPDMYDACVMAVGLIKLQRDLIEGGKHAAAWNPAIQMLEAAITKAKGA